MALDIGVTTLSIFIMDWRPSEVRARLDRTDPLQWHRWLTNHWPGGSCDVLSRVTWSRVSPAPVHTGQRHGAWQQFRSLAKWGFSGQDTGTHYAHAEGKLCSGMWNMEAHVSRDSSLIKVTNTNITCIISTITLHTIYTALSAVDKLARGKKEDNR